MWQKVSFQHITIKEECPYEMRKLASVILGFTAVCAMSVTAFAGTWQSDTSGWWYRRDEILPRRNMGMDRQQWRWSG